VPESGSLGSERGAASNGRPYRDTLRRRVVNTSEVVETRSVIDCWDKSAGDLITGRVAIGVKGA
jgi:hypothetical protein